MKLGRYTVIKLYEITHKSIIRWNVNLFIKSGKPELRSLHTA